MPQEIPASLDWTIGPQGWSDRDTPATPGAVEFHLGYRLANHSQNWGREIPIAGDPDQRRDDATPLVAKGAAGGGLDVV